MSRYENEAKEKQSPLQLGKHKDSGGIGDEEVYSSKRRYLSPVELYCDSSGTFEIGSKREERLRQLVDGQSTDKRHRLDDDHHKSDSYEGPGNIEHEQTRQRSVSCAVSEFGTTCSTVTLQPSVQPSDQPLLLDMLISASNDSTEMMVCDNASRAMDDPLLPPLGKLEMSSPMIVPEERPQMPQIIGGYATNYPHFLTAEYFQAAQQAGGTSAYFGPPIEDHSPVDENGFLDYYRYQFDELSTLGKGHSSHVYMVRCLEDGKTYALKRSIRPFQGRKDRVRKLTEVSAMWLLDSHPNLVRLVNSWEQFGLLYILSDLCDQGDLQSLLNSFNLPVPEPFVWKLLSAVSSGLAHIHSHDFVHLDLKPANICFADNYATIKIADFGLASPISSLPSPSSSPSPDHEGDRVYLAPEVLHHGLCGKPADIFSLGLIVLEMCANVVLPHNGEEYSQLRSNNLSSAQLDLVSISDELRSLISQMLDSNPSKRPTAQHIASLPLCSTYSQIPFNLH